MQKRFDYALFLVSRLKEQGGVYVDIGTIVGASGLPKAYLEKVAQELKRAGWLESRKGPGGGYRMAQKGEAVSIQALIDFYHPMREFCPVLRRHGRT